ncbi:TRIO and F-actin-binding protein-like [Hylaeus anthracinus]|uniref:TRIO and F-actin-binding protein-like n=1 Tax=Hylaeus anthracinus TaxID=313031 RepID=UPI0023BA2D89|nr:TRIO and F-actin-binding protein-like [Hylaeus anthracinus]
MNGIRTLVLQDLPHVLPPKGLQLSSSHLHTATSTRRFWSFFVFSSKEDACRGTKKCPASKDVISTPLISTNEVIEDVSKTANVSPISRISTLPLPPKLQYPFDLRTAPMSCLSIPRPLKEDNLMSLLDGNPVPRTLKWKLKGYKTLRNEQAGDFAFVPGGDAYDLDILPRKEYSETLKPTDSRLGSLDRALSSSKATGPSSQAGDTLSLTTKAIENKQYTLKAVEAKVEKVDEAKIEEPSAPSTANLSVPAAVESVPGEMVPTMPKLLASSAKMEIKYLPIAKTNLPAIPMKCQSQPSAQYSSRPPKKTQQTNRRSSDIEMQDAGSGRYREREIVSRERQDYSMARKQVEEEMRVAGARFDPEVSNQEIPRSSSEFSPRTVETKSDSSKIYDLQQSENANARFNPELTETESKEVSNQRKQFLDNSEFSSKTVERRPDASQRYTSQQSEYFAPRSWKYDRVNPPTSNQLSHTGNKSTRGTLSSVYESITGVPAKETTPLKIAYQKQQPKTSPCAATQARLQGGRNSMPQRQSNFGYDGSSMSGSSGGGSRKPPGSYPPFTARQASSDSSSLLSRQPRDTQKSRGTKAKTSASRISTSARRPAPRKCGDDEGREGKTVCTKPRDNNKCRRRSCEQEDRQKCKKESKKTCKRYCCPALQTPVECDYDNFQCPKQRNKNDCGKRREKRTHDPTCLPNDSKCSDRREDTCNRRRNDCQRSCKRERSCGAERRDRSCNRDRQSCNRERQSCSRGRERSCQRQERRDCSDRDQGRVICTKPRRGDSCNQRRNDDCGQRSAKCTGRRNYTNSAYLKDKDSVKRFSSVPALGFSLIGMNVQGNESKATIGSSSNCRFLGVKEFSSGCKYIDKKPDKCKKASDKCKTASDNCKTPQTKCKQQESSQRKCKTASDNCKTPQTKCKQQESSQSKCKTASDNCKTPQTKCKQQESSQSKCKPRKTEDKCKRDENQCGALRKAANKCKSTCGVSKPEKPPSCQQSGSKSSKSDDYCTKRREQICKDRKSTSEDGESSKDRTDRERKEMQECKKDIGKRDKKKSKDEKKAAPAGLERVVSPCKQKQKNKSDKCSTSSSKVKCISTALNCLANRDSLMMLDSRSFNSLSDRSYSTVMFSRSQDHDLQESSSNQWRDFWNGFDPEAELPTPGIIENQEAPEDSSYSRNWFLSWF